MTRTRCLMLLVMALALTAHGGDGVKTNAAMPSIMAEGYYAREVNDGAWSIRIRGPIPAQCGAWLLVYDADGKVLHSGLVPHGDYPDDRPFVVTIPADRRTGDCVIKLIGMQENMLGLRLPLTDLPREVYGGRHFAVRDGRDGQLCFKGVERPKAKPTLDEALAIATADGAAAGGMGRNRVTLSAYKGQLTVKHDSGKVAASTRTPLEGTEIESDKYNNYTTFPTAPGEIYRLEVDAMYFSSTNALYLAWASDRWFLPDLRFESIKWWNLK